MSLVPILYTSLIIFAILMVVLLTISYTAYKVKNRSKQTDHREEVTYQYLTRPIYDNSLSKSKAKTGSTIKVVSTIKKPELKKTTTLPLKRKRTEVINDRYSKTKVENEAKDVKPNYSYHAYDCNEDLNGSDSSPANKQSAVLNYTTDESNNEENTRTHGSGYSNLPKYYPNFQVINYYTDNDDDHYFYKPNRYFQ